MYGLNNASKTPIAAITLLVWEKAFSQRLLIETKIKSWPVLNFNTTFATKSAHWRSRPPSELRLVSDVKLTFKKSSRAGRL